jgi:hypothetical protein
VFATPVVSMGISESVEKLKSGARGPAMSVREAMDDALVKMIAWLITMAVFGISTGVIIGIIRSLDSKVADLVQWVTLPMVILAGLVSAVNGLRFGVLSRNEPWSADLRVGVGGFLQNPGDFDVIVSAAIVLPGVLLAVTG